METVSFVILHYGSIEVTNTCIHSILQMDHQEYIRIVIVDNEIQKSASERKQAFVRYADDSRIMYMPICENGGFSYANNIGYRLAKNEQKASYVVILNNDIEFIQKDFLTLLMQSCQRNLCHVLGPDVIRRSTGEHQNPMDTRIRTREEAEYTIRMNRIGLKYYHILYPLLYWQLRRTEKNSLLEKKKKETFYETVQKDIVPFGACLIFTPMFVQEEEVAFAPEPRFFYEEYMLTYRCQKKGYHIVYDPSLKVYHESGAATKKSYKNEKKRMRFMMERTAEACEMYLKTLDGKI